MPVEEVVVGDMLVLKPGTYVAADSRIVKAHRLSVDESMLTGESMPVDKDAGRLKHENTPLADRSNMVYMGTLVTGGQGLAVVVATGRFTEVGMLQAMMSETETPKTPIELQLALMGNQLVLACGAICGVVFGIGFVRGYGLDPDAQDGHIAGGLGGARRPCRPRPPSTSPWASPTCAAMGCSCAGCRPWKPWGRCRPSVSTRPGPSPKTACRSRKSLPAEPGTRSATTASRRFPMGATF